MGAASCQPATPPCHPIAIRRPGRHGTARVQGRVSASIVLLGLALLACGGPSSDVDAATVEAWIADGGGPLLLDVRSPEEYASGHVPGALNIPHDELAGRLDEVEAARDSGVVVYCERGGRAARAESLLRESGFGSVRHLAGDMASWRAAGRRQQ